jgi:hypothetical protein
MLTAAELDEYMAEIREQVCSRCIDRPPGGPPCAPLGKRCGIELHLAEIVEICHNTRSRLVEPYTNRFHEDVCTHCANRPTSQCPCPLEYLLPLALDAIEAVDERRRST